MPLELRPTPADAARGTEPPLVGKFPPGIERPRRESLDLYWFLLPIVVTLFLTLDGPSLLRRRPAETPGPQVIEALGLTSGVTRARPVSDSRLMPVLGIQTVYGLWMGAYQDSEGSMWPLWNGPVIETWADPLVWCWPVHQDSNEVQLAPGSLGSTGPYALHSGEYVVEWGTGAEIRRFGMDYRAGLGSLMTQVQFREDQYDAAAALMLPVFLWTQYHAALPTDYDTVMRDLRLAPIDGRLAELLRPLGGEAVIYKYSLAPVLAMGFEGETDVIDGKAWELPGTFVVSAVEGDLGYAFDGLGTGSLPPDGAWEVWARISEDSLEREVSGAALAAACQTELWSREMADSEPRGESKYAFDPSDLLK